ncbi:hypothetical protein KEJ18_06065 [Candidatus Bathyarchaeota archaeon]|nr:hypothetical protein [Candidatus Bathyarchaeota archaeon]
MPTTTMDTLLSCFVMITLTLSSMVGVYAIVHPFLQDQKSWNETQLSQKIAEYLLIEPGNPQNWGANLVDSLENFGLAKAGFTSAFELDIDKVTRLNSENVYNISFLDAFSALGAPDKPFRIEINPVFDVSVNLTSKQEGLLETVYTFEVTTRKSGMLVAASINCYAVFANEVASNSSSTSSSGTGTVEISLLNTGNGTALFIVFAETEPRIVSYAVYSFGHQLSGNPHSRGEYATLSPIDYTLRVDLVSETNIVSNGMVFTCDHWFSLDELNKSLTTQFFGIPQLLDASPLVLVGTGVDGETYFAEWTVYPQIPVDFGLDFTSQFDLTDYCSFRYFVTINSAVYVCEVTVGGT